MCIFAVLYRVIPECPLFVLTNRDESTSRPSLPPQAFRSQTGCWFGGADARVGGTWFGINEHGLIAAVTNRAKLTVPPDPRSRGLLCRDALGMKSASAAVDLVVRAASEGNYAGFNLILLARESAWVVEGVDEVEVTKLDSGIHVIGNGSPNAEDDFRVTGTKALVQRMVEQTSDWTMYLERSQEICRIHGEEKLPAVCMHRDHWGTVGSTIAAVPADPDRTMYHYAPGPPCVTPYADYSVAFREILIGERPNHGVWPA